MTAPAPAPSRAPAAVAPRALGPFFLRKFLREPGEVASVWPSSRFLARAMLADVRLAPGDAVVELGPGTGSFTQAIAPLLAATERSGYLALDRDPEFIAVLRARFPELEFVQADAATLAAELAARPQLRPKVIVSGLPLVAMPKPVVEQLLAFAFELLPPGGTFRTFSYLHTVVNPASWWLRRRMREVFGDFRVRGPVLRNVPPALVFDARKAT